MKKLKKNSLIITAAHYDKSGKHLVYVFVGVPPERSDRTVDGMRLFSREQLVDALHRGKSFVTAFKIRDEWQYEGVVRLLEIDSQAYLRIDDQAVAVDDLGNLAKIRASN